MIKIQAKIDGFRRAGVAHSMKPIEYEDDFFSDHQMKLLEDEPNLIITKSDSDKSDPPAKEELLVTAISKLDTDKANKGHWTGKGAPQTAALEAVLKEMLGKSVTVSAAERNAAYETYQKNQNSGE